MYTVSDNLHIIVLMLNFIWGTDGHYKPNHFSLGDGNPQGFYWAWGSPAPPYTENINLYSV